MVYKRVILHVNAEISLQYGLFGCIETQEGWKQKPDNNIFEIWKKTLCLSFKRKEGLQFSFVIEIFSNKRERGRGERVREGFLKSQ